MLLKVQRNKDAFSLPCYVADGIIDGHCTWAAWMIFLPRETEQDWPSESEHLISSAHGSSPTGRRIWPLIRPRYVARAVVSGSRTKDGHIIIIEEKAAVAKYVCSCASAQLCLLMQPFVPSAVPD
jgi:hypothetical protein